MWGFGHTSSIIIIGVLIAGLSLTIGNEFFIGAELIVGVMLIALGVFTIRNKNILGQSHIHPHTHEDGISHVHAHNHTKDHKHDHKSFIIGSIHGIAGSGSIVALTASVFMGFETMMYFLVLFGIGSIIGMAVISGIIGLPFILSSKMKQTVRYMKYVISGITCLIGVNIIFTIISDYKLFWLELTEVHYYWFLFLNNFVKFTPRFITTKNTIAAKMWDITDAIYAS